MQTRVVQKKPGNGGKKTKAFLAVEGGKATTSTRIHQIVDKLTFQIVTALFRRISTSGILHIEEIQDQVELALMRSGEHKVAAEEMDIQKWEAFVDKEMARGVNMCGIENWGAVAMM